MSLKDTIIQHSYEIFYQHGFHASGVELLAKKSGTTKRTLYAHFGNKQGLIKAVLDYRHHDFMQQLHACFAKQPIHSFEMVMAVYFEFLQAWIGSDNFYGCLFIHASGEFTDPNSMPYQAAHQHKQQLRQFLVDQLEQTDAVCPQRQADGLFVFGEGMIASAQTGQSNIDITAHDLIAMLTFA